MKNILYIALFLLSITFSYAQKTAYNTIYEANKLYEKGQYEKAIELYKKALSVNDKHIEAKFNLADALYKTEKYEEAQKYFNNIIQESHDKNLTSQAYHNLGNTFFQLKKYKEAQKAYQNALINNPKNEDARYNLAYVNELLRQQQNQQNNQNNNQQNQDKQNQDKQNNQNQDKNKQNQDKQKDQNKNQENKDNKDQNKNDKNNQQENKKPDNQQEKNENEENKQQQQPTPGQLSKEDAQRMLDALNQNEEKTLKKLRKIKSKNLQKVKIDKDW